MAIIRAATVMIKRFDPEDLKAKKQHKISKAELMAKHKFNTAEMEIAIANYFNFRRNLIIPNVSYGMMDYEADLIIVNPKGLATEVEIKISALDLKKDKKKGHHHNNELVHRLYFAIPYYLENYLDDIPKKAGILLVKPIFKDIVGYKTKSYVECIRGPRLNKVDRWDDNKRMQITRLSTMRIWSLKEKLFNIKRQGNSK